MRHNQDHINELERLGDRYIKYLKYAFLSAIVTMNKNIDDAALEEADTIEEVLREVDPDQFNDLLYGIGQDKSKPIFFDEARNLFNLAAMAAFLQLTTGQQRRWNYNPTGESVIATQLSDSMRIATELTDSLKASLTIALNPTVAYTSNLSVRIRDMKQTLGLTEPQVQAVVNFRNQLENRKLFGLTAPQNRLVPEVDRILLRDHMKNNTLTPSGINRMVNRYYESLLNQRATEVATGVAMTAINAGMNTMWNQGLNQGVFDVRDRKFWVTAGDAKVRPTHRAIPGMNPQGVPINSMFITPTGLVPYPLWGMGDYVHCRCIVVLGRI